MKKLYTPWRQQYVARGTDPSGSNSHKPCIFCEYLSQNRDEENFILKRYKNSFLVLNLYPYNAGHLMVLPNEHKENLNDLSQETRAEIFEVTNEAIELVKKVLKPEGINVGLNLGRASGAGLPSHLHIHIVPRWNGDTNFMPIIAGTKVISFDLKEIYKKLTEQ